METNNRRDFLKKAALAGASALVAPSLFAADGEGRGELSPKIKAGDLESIRNARTGFETEYFERGDGCND